MKRHWWLLIWLWALAASCEAEGDAKSRIVLQNVFAAGLRYHDAKTIWGELMIGDPITLVREVDNPVDPNAVRIDWKGHVLGYLPRSANQFASRQLDRGFKLQARISVIDKYRNHRRKLGIEIYSALDGRQ